MTTKMTVERLQLLLTEMDDGVLRCGSHKAGSREFCALEFESQVRGRKWSDTPITMPDIRPLNDMFGTGPRADKLRTAALLPLMAALWDWSNWSITRKQKFATCLIIGTVQEIISELPGLSKDIREACRKATTLEAARAAAEAAARAAGVIVKVWLKAAEESKDA